MYGTTLPADLTHAPLRSVIGECSRTPSGNLAVRVGRENPDGQSWHQTEYVVLTPDEVRQFFEELAHLGFTPDPDRH